MLQELSNCILALHGIGVALNQRNKGHGMSNTPHTLADEFPGQAEAIHKLKVADPRFAKLLKEYDEVNDQVHLAETNIAPVDQMKEVDLRKRRLQIKDAIAQALSA
jgi:uncharacterized protein YdcH (DUF465 family)